MNGERKSLRIPVFLDVHCDLDSGPRIKGKITDLGTEGVSIKTKDPIVVREKLTLEFLLPDTFSSIKLTGEVAWCRFQYQDHQEKERQFSAGIKFIDLMEPYRSLIRDYTLKLLCDEDTMRKQGVDRVLADISGLPEKDRNRAVAILNQKGLIDKMN